MSWLMEVFSLKIVTWKRIVNSFFVNILSDQHICFVFVLLWYYYCFSSFALQISWVIVPIGQ